MTTDRALAELVEALGGTDKAAAMVAAHKAAPVKRQAKRQPKSAEYHMTQATVAKPVARAVAYGIAPVVLDSNRYPDAKGTHVARAAALEAVIPGFGKAANIFSVGLNAKKLKERDFKMMLNVPFTYIDLPGGKDQSIGSLTPEQVRAALKAAGYGFTRQTAPDGSQQCFWGCDSRGRPLSRKWGAAKQNVAATALYNAANDDD